MTKTVRADYIGKVGLGYVLLALPSENLRNRIIALLEELTAKLPGIIWPMPASQLHITLCEIIQFKEYSQVKQELYDLCKEQYEHVPSQILGAVSKFKVTFDVIEASSQAIIIRASDSSNFNDMRAKLMAHMQLPNETRTPPDITHSSIARYLKEVDLENVQEVISRHKILIEEEITEFMLLRTEIPPLQKYTVIQTIPLASS
jgi:hypothetical protein